MDKLTLTFVKSPQLGKAKTRLAATIGAAKALEVYEALLQHTCSVLLESPGDKMVFYAEKISHDDLWSEAGFKKDLQPEGDLGDRMKKAFQTGFAMGYEKVVIIGSDCYDLQIHHLQEAFQALEETDLVFGPALDGGYYLMGMKKIHHELFDNKSWSTDKLLGETLETAQQQGLSFHLLEALSDIDYEEDLKGDLLAIVNN